MAPADDHVRQCQQALLEARAGNWDSERVLLWLAGARDHQVDQVALAVARGGGGDAAIAAARERMVVEVAGWDPIGVLADYVAHLEDRAGGDGVELDPWSTDTDTGSDTDGDVHGAPGEDDGVANGEDDPWNDLRDTDDIDHEADDEADDGSAQTSAGASEVVVGLVCPECGEDAVEQPPTAQVPYGAHGQPVPSYSHPDGEPLCPVMGPRGYQPAAPVEVLDEAGVDPLDTARAAVTAADHAATHEPAPTTGAERGEGSAEGDMSADACDLGWDR